MLSPIDHANEIVDKSLYSFVNTNYQEQLSTFIKNGNLEHKKYLLSFLKAGHPINEKLLSAIQSANSMSKQGFSKACLASIENSVEVRHVVNLTTLCAAESEDNKSETTSNIDIDNDVPVHMRKPLPDSYKPDFSIDLVNTILPLAISVAMIAIAFYQAIYSSNNGSS
jgi:hypothetical protein